MVCSNVGRRTKTKKAAKHIKIDRNFYRPRAGLILHCLQLGKKHRNTLTIEYHEIFSIHLFPFVLVEQILILIVCIAVILKKYNKPGEK